MVGLKHKAYWYEAIPTLILALIVVAIRLGFRVKRIGLSNFEVDDYLMFATALMLLTLDGLYFWESSYNDGASSFQWDGVNPTWFHPTPSDIQQMIWGSQVMLIYTFLYNILIWSTKFCMCIVYWRLMSGIHSLRRLVQIGFAVTVVTFTAATITLLTACRPFSAYWQTPRPQSVECSVAFGPLVRIVPPVLNICADFYLIVPPAIMIWFVRTTRDRKITLVVVFGSSMFLVIVAALRIGLPYTVDSKNLALANTQWAARECWVALITTNFPVIFGEMNKLGISKWIRKRFQKPAPPFFVPPQDPEASANAPISGYTSHSPNNASGPVFGTQVNAEPRVPSSLSRRSKFTEDLNDNDHGLHNPKRGDAKSSTENFELESLCSDNDQRVILPRETV